MKINDLCNTLIYECPTLFRVYKNPELSRMKVLSHLFFTIGNGFDWSIKGILHEINEPKKKLVQLPEDYFDKKLYEFVLYAKHNEFAEILRSKNYYFYTTKNYPSGERFYFEATESQAEELIAWNNYQEPTIKAMMLPKFQSLILAENKSGVFNPYRICNYSAIAELINRKTNSSHIQNFSFDEFPPKPDHIEACMDLVLFTKRHFEKQQSFDEDQMAYLDKFIAMYGK